jgi:redox-sensing transcriptional repressor
MPRSIPEPALRRLPKYRHYLGELAQKGIQTVSCSQIGADLNLLPIQVRKDLQITGIVGKPKVGYSITELTTAIENFLGWDNTKEAFLVGAGSLGTALLGYPRFEKFGLDIVAAFDTDPEKIGRWVHDRLILSLEKLPDLARRMSIHIGIITVPAAAAQRTAELLLESGILAIWNFAPVTLKVPSGIILHSEDLYYSLASLSRRLTEVMAKANHPALLAVPPGRGAGISGEMGNRGELPRGEVKGIAKVGSAAGSSASFRPGANPAGDVD